MPWVYLVGAAALLTLLGMHVIDKVHPRQAGGRVSLPWVKLHTSLLDNDRFVELSTDARLTFLVAIAYAGKLDQDGALVIEGVGPAGPRHLSRYSGLTEPKQRAAIADLCAVGFLAAVEADGVTQYSISRWSEKAGDDSRLVAARERSRRYRVTQRERASERSSSPVTPMSPVTPIVTDKEKEEEEEAEATPLPPALPSASEVPRDATEARNRPLGLDHNEIAQARELLNVVWALMGGLRGTSRSKWADAGNKPVALDMVRNGVTVAMVTAAWHSASERLGEPVYTMKKVQEEIGRLALKPVASRSDLKFNRGDAMDATIDDLQKAQTA